jgi:hypothetical protein
VEDETPSWMKPSRRPPQFQSWICPLLIPADSSWARLTTTHITFLFRLSEYNLLSNSFPWVIHSFVSFTRPFVCPFGRHTIRSHHSLFYFIVSVHSLHFELPHLLRRSIQNSEPSCLRHNSRNQQNKNMVQIPQLAMVLAGLIVVIGLLALILCLVRKQKSSAAGSFTILPG